MSEDDKLFNFVSELQGWAQCGLCQQGVKGLPSEMTVVKAIVDIKLPNAKSTDVEKPYNNKGSNRARQRMVMVARKSNHKMEISGGKPSKELLVASFVAAVIGLKTA